METSFISEHSLEYLIVPKLTLLLKRRFTKVVPIYYWSTREGNTLSSVLNEEYVFKLFAVFPRRPKIDKISSNLVCGKINASIITYSERAKLFQVPTIYCFPIITSFCDIDNNPRFIMMNVKDYEPLDIYFKIDKRTSKINFEGDNFKRINILNDNSILELAYKGKEYRWPEAINIINDLRNVSKVRENYSFWFWRTAIYKPIYFLLFN